MKTTIYCVSKNGYRVTLNITEKVYRNAHMYVSGRIYEMLNL
ncbi:hypothetical protein [Leptotrichia sp. OH3620_COT-345]|nr:hypothetical protein [Leptotrichia sp. OH3620_COT-345]